MKVDPDRRLLSGIATPETPDRAGEILDCASSKPYFEQWSAEALVASGGNRSALFAPCTGPSRSWRAASAITADNPATRPLPSTAC